MRFKYAEKEFLHHHQMERAFSEAMERRWLLRESIPGRHGSSDGSDRDFDPGLEVRVGRSSWGSDRVHLGVFVSRANGNSCDPFRDLTMDELRQVMACRMTVDLWVSGAIDELPLEAPKVRATKRTWTEDDDIERDGDKSAIRNLADELHRQQTEVRSRHESLGTVHEDNLCSAIVQLKTDLSRDDVPGDVKELIRIVVDYARRWRLDR